MAEKKSIFSLFPDYESPLGDWITVKKQIEEEKQNEDTFPEVLLIEGPFNDQGKLVTFVSKQHAYYYLATLNETPTEESIKNVKWAVSYDNEKTTNALYLFSAGKIQNGKLRVDIQISKGDDKYKIYAYTGDTPTSHNGYAEAFYKKVVVFFIGGAGDKEKFAGVEPTNIIRNQLQYSFIKSYNTNKQYISVYLGYNEVFGETRVQKNVIPQIPSKEGTTVYIIGHSLGGWNGAELANILSDKGYKVELLVTLDPVGRNKAAYAVIDIYKFPPDPICTYWIDIYTNPDDMEIDDFVASFGQQWIPPKNRLTIFNETKLHHWQAGDMFRELIKTENISASDYFTDLMAFNLNLK